MNSFNYDEITLQNIDDNKMINFICDGDSKKIYLESKIANKLTNKDKNDLYKQFPTLGGKE